MKIRKIIEDLFVWAFCLAVLGPIAVGVVVFLWHWWPILLHLAVLAGMVLLLSGINAVCKSGGMVISHRRKK